MARPKKPESMRMDDDLRIPLTSAQKDVIRQAAVATGMDMTAWARPILLANAERALAEKKKKPAAR
jgi:uncharacterized protein (DUF1778 family)